MGKWKLNFVLVSLCVLLAIGSGVLGFHDVQVMLSIAPVAVSAISIIFGLSLALITVSSRPAHVSAEVVKSPETREEMKRDIIAENKRTIDRQKYLVLVFLFAVVFGILFLGASNIAPGAFLTKVFSAIFGFVATLSLLLAFFLPFTISVILARDSDLNILQG